MYMDTLSKKDELKLLEMKLFNRLKKHEKVIIYGAGKAANIVLIKMLMLCDDLEVYCVAVSETEAQPYVLWGKTVVAIEKLVEYAEDVAILIATKEDKHEHIKKKLSCLGFRNVYAITDELFYEWTEETKNECNWKKNKVLFSNRYIKPYIFQVESLCRDKGYDDTIRRSLLLQYTTNIDKKKLVLPRLVVTLGTRCNLQCKECNNLMPFFKPQFDLDADKIVRALELLLEKCNVIVTCELIGGEPFLASNLKRLLEFLVKQDKIKQIEITTNGGVLPRGEVIMLLRNEKVKVRISDYGKLINKEKILCFLTTEDIQYQILELGQWISPGGIYKRGKEQSVLKKEYNACSSGYLCKTLYEDKLFSCARAASLAALGFMKEQEYISINDSTTISEIRDFLLKEYSEACDYCDIMSSSRIYVEPAGQLNV